MEIYMFPSAKWLYTVLVWYVSRMTPESSIAYGTDI